MQVIISKKEIIIDFDLSCRLCEGKDEEMKSNSWIITRAETGEAVLETFSRRIMEAINTDKYKVWEAYDYLVRLNDPETLEYKAARNG